MVLSLSRSLKALISLMALSVVAACASLSAPSVDTVYVNGKVITADKSFTIAQAVAVKDGKFVGVGTSDEMRRYASPTTRLVDLKGRAVVPGLMDSHTHMIGAGERAYHPGYYAAFVRDPDGNNIEAVFHGETERSAASVRIRS